MRMERSVVAVRSSLQRHVSRVRLGVAMAAILVASVLAPAAPASAAVVLQTSGTIGTWAGDTEAFVLFECSREPDPDDVGAWDYNVKILASPANYARDRTAGTDTQRVGYRVVLQARVNGKWSSTLGTYIRHGKATDVTPAAITPWGVGGIGGAGVGALRTFVTLYWYKTDGRTIAGKVRFRAQWYIRDNALTKGNCAYP